MAGVYASSFLFIILATAEFIYARTTTSLSPATEVAFQNGQVRTPLSEVSDGELHRYSANINGAGVRFLLYRRPDRKIATVLDACEICGPVGFYRSSNGITCKNCAAPVNPQAVGQPGGCNPIPLKASVTNESVIVTQSDLAAGAARLQK